MSMSVALSVKTVERGAKRARQRRRRASKQPPLASPFNTPALGHNLSYAQLRALHDAFHQEAKNKFLHLVGTPMVVAGSLTLLSSLPGALGSAIPWLLTAGATSILAPLDPAAASFVGLYAGASTFVAQSMKASESVATEQLALAGFATQAFGWFLTVVLGHMVFEPTIKVKATDQNSSSQIKEVGSNIYFERGYHYLRDVGVPVTVLDRLAEFAISLTDCPHEILVALGLRGPELGKLVEGIIKQIKENMKNDGKPF